ncbi:protein-tyrosine phosphatase-like protein [Mucor lusitanicus]|uniref:protein-tyrosine-phosphatase n=1 Tax=Mucor lusitanicus CBS 277.49 TaxID=747725 RepID=A0A168N6Z8_MUCCL|nr:hypothetical protein MUCCIDRAFT_79052 [Mucor lusitanicus CBS 277.49]
MCKRNLKKLALNLPPSSSSPSEGMMPATPIVMSRNASSNQRNTKHAQDMQECTSNIYQQGPACILPNLYLGAYYNALNATQLSRHGITCVINVASEVSIVSLPQHIEYHHIKWTHSQLDLAASGFERAVALIRTAHDRRHTVMVHCQQGIERSAALVVAFVMKSTRCTRRINATVDREDTLAGQNWSFDRAFNFVREKAPKIRPNMELLYQLREYEQSIPMGQHYQTSSSREDKRHNIRNRTKRSESVACSKPSAKSDAALTSSTSLRSLNQTVYYQRPRSASVRDTSSSANLSFAATATTAPKSSTSCCKQIEKQPLAIAALIIVLVAIYQQKYRPLHRAISNCKPDNSINDVLGPKAMNSSDGDGHTSGSNYNDQHLTSSRFLKPVFPIY